MHQFAQTNIQLYLQMLEAGFDESDLDLARRSWETATPLFAARLRSNGKPFLAHLVGTASILAWMCQSGATVAAGMLHAAYMQGDFGDGHAGVTSVRRSRLSNGTSTETEELVHAYTGFAWSPEAVDVYTSRLPDLTEREKVLLRMRLANELEDHLDLGMLFSSKGPERARRGERFETQCAELARILGHESLGDELRDAFDSARNSSVPKLLVSDESKSISIEPKRGRARRALRRLLQRLLSSL